MKYYYKKRQSQICLMKNKQKEIKNHFFIDKEKYKKYFVIKKEEKVKDQKIF